MSNSSFRFKQFTVCHDRCAMKVGTDGVLLGAWAPVGRVGRILDVGTGTGLIALQLAQRAASATVVALEIDPEAARQAAENVARSPWVDRMEVVCQDFRRYAPDGKFDLIVSNPPYYVDAMKCPDPARRVARHADLLGYPLLMNRSARLLDDGGTLALIIPAEAGPSVTEAAFAARLHLTRRVQVFTRAGKPCRRLLLAFGLHAAACSESTLCIESRPGTFSPEYVALTRPFYLKMP